MTELRAGDLMYLHIDHLTYDPADRQRGDISAENIEEMAKSIKEHGLITPIAVYKPTGEPPPYKIIAGITRYCALRDVLGRDNIPCRVYEGHLNRYQLKAIELEENIRRTNLTDTERNVAINELHEIMVTIAAERGEKHTQTDTAVMAGVSQATVNSSIQIAKRVRHLMVTNPGIDVRNLSPTKIMKDHERTVAEMNNKIKAKELEIARAKAPIKPRVPTPPVQKTTEEATTVEEVPTSFDPQKMFDVMDSYVVGDFFSNDLPDGKFSFIECDPPYGINLPEMRDAEYKGSLETNYTEITDEEYPDFLRKLVKELYRLASPDSYTIIWHSIVYNNLLNNELEKVGFLVHPHHLGIWKKGNTSGQSRHPDIMLGYSCEYFVFARKGHASLQPKKRGRSNVFDFNKVAPSINKHPTERPLPLMLELVDTFASPGGSILVPFAGSGVTLLAAGLRNHHAVGYDLSENYKHQFMQKVMNTAEFKQTEMKFRG